MPESNFIVASVVLTVLQLIRKLILISDDQIPKSLSDSTDLRSVIWTGCHKATFQRGKFFNW